MFVAERMFQTLSLTKGEKQALPQHGCPHPKQTEKQQPNRAVAPAAGSTDEKGNMRQPA